MSSQFDLKSIQARWVLDMLPDSALPRLAVAALKHSLASDSLVALATLSDLDTYHARSLFEQALKELGFPPLSVSEARKVQADRLNKRNEPGSELRSAAGRGNVSSVMNLLGAGEAVDARNEYEQTPLIYAAHNGHKRVAELLIRHEANLNAQDYYRRTALMFASKRGHLQTVHLLLNHGAKIDMTDINLATAMMMAATSGYFSVVKALVRAGADIHAQAYNSLNAAQMARIEGRNNIAEYLSQLMEITRHDPPHKC